MLLQVLDCSAVMLYSDQICLGCTTEATELWYRIEHYEPSEEGRANEQTARPRHRDTDDRSGSRRLQRQRTDDLPGYPERQAQSLSAQQGLSDQARRFTGVVRGISRNRSRQRGNERLKSRPDVYIEFTSGIQHHSASRTVAGTLKLTLR